MTSPSETASYCATCDALPGECHHAGHRYLDDMTYEPGPDGHGWIVPQHERQRFNMEPLRPDPPKPTAALDLVDLERLLEEILWLEPPVREALASAYERDDQTATLAVKAVIAAAGTGRITNPAGLLLSKIRNIQAAPREEVTFDGEPT